MPGGAKLDLVLVYVYLIVFVVDVVAVALVFEYLGRGAGLSFIISALLAYSYLRRAVHARRKRDE